MVDPASPVGVAGRELAPLDEGVVRVRRQIKKLGREYVFALAKNDEEQIVPMPPLLESMAKLHLEEFGSTKFELPWERLGGQIVEVDLLFIWGDGRPMRARLFDGMVWKPALASAGAIAPPATDGRGRRHYKTDRRSGLHQLRG